MTATDFLQVERFRNDIFITSLQFDILYEKELTYLCREIISLGDILILIL